MQETGYKRYVTFRTPRALNNFNKFEDSTGSCWVGNNVRAYANGDWHFPNYVSDTIVIKVNVALNDNWVFYSDTTSRWFEAKVIIADTQTVFGVLDSVKIIEITAKSGNASLPADPITGFKIILSKAHGFATVPDLYWFPYKELSAPPLLQTDYWFHKIDNVPNSMTPSKMVFRHIHNWNRPYTIAENFVSGDAFYTQQDRWGDGSVQFRTHEYNRVISRQDYADSSIYSLDILSSSTDFHNPTTYSHRVSSLKVMKELLLDTLFMPEEYIPLNSQAYYTHTYLQYNNSSFCSDSLLVISDRRQGKGLYI